MRIHLTPDGPKRCGVDENNPRSRGCKYGDAPHYSDWESAEKAHQEELAGKYGASATVEAKPEEPEEVRYSFLKNWKEAKDRFTTDFEGFPNRFFSTEIFSGKIANSLANVDLGYQFPGDVLARLATVASSPSDLSASDEKVVELAESIGLTDVEMVQDASLARSMRTDRLWKASLNGTTVLISGKAQSAKSMRDRFTISGRGSSLGEFVIMDVRGVAASSRLKRKTGINPADLLLSPKVSGPMVKDSKGNWVRRPKEEVAAEREAAKVATIERGKKIMELVKATEAAQREGANFKSQERYIRDHTGKKLASAWEDKLYPSKSHQKLARETLLLKDFAKVEIDNDVSPEEFKDFEKTWESERQKLPKIPGGIQPTLRIRKLGKHRANGLYAPHVNTVCIDVRTSAATVHEMGHYYDLAVKRNASLSKEFSSVVSDYSRGLKVPPGLSRGAAYYTTPTEVFARGFELYATERLGVSGRVVKPSEDYKTRFDYKPFVDEPELKEKLFKIFDGLFS